MAELHWWEMLRLSWSYVSRMDSHIAKGQSNIVSLDNSHSRSRRVYAYLLDGGERQMGR